jgi:FKBP-type peptidyl-prolyl cis-trans isomerase
MEVVRIVGQRRRLPAAAPDATKTGSGLVYAKLVANDAGVRPSRSDTVLVQYTGWRQGTGDTFFTTKGRARPIAIDIAHAAPGFTEALPLLHKGETAMLWVPPSAGTPETVVYQIEVVDIVAPPATTRRTQAAHP